MKSLVCFLGLVCSPMVLADAPYVDSNWQWNKNVKIKSVFGFWNQGRVALQLDNGEVCYINSDDKSQISIAIAMRAQQTSGEIVCELQTTGSMDGKNLRRVHRLSY